MINKRFRLSGNNSLIIEFLWANLNSIIGFVCLTIVAVNARRLPEGFERIYLLPISYILCSLLFSRVFNYLTKSLGMMVIYATIIVRYLGTPVLMAITGSSVNTLRSSSSSCLIAIIVSIFELIVVMILINYLWPRYRTDNREYKDIQYVSDFRIKPLGLVFLIYLGYSVLTRGHLDNVIDHLSTWFYFHENNSVLYTYDMLALMLIKNVVAIALICFFARIANKSAGFTRAVCFVLSLAVAFANTMVFDFRERTDLIILFFSTMYVMTSCYKKEANMLKILFTLAGVGLLVIVFAQGTLGVQNARSLGSNFLVELEKSSELYTSGPSVIAKMIDSYSLARGQMRFETYLYDIVDGMSFLSMIPGLRFIPEMLNGVIGTTRIFVYTIGGYTYILPNYSLCSLYVTDIFGWMLEIVFFYFSIRMVIAFANKRNTSTDSFLLFSIVFFEVFAAGSVFCSNFQLFWHSVSHEPFWFLMFILINNLSDRVVFRTHK